MIDIQCVLSDDEFKKTKKIYHGYLGVVSGLLDQLTEDLITQLLALNTMRNNALQGYNDLLRLQLSLCMTIKNKWTNKEKNSKSSLFFP